MSSSGRSYRLRPNKYVDREMFAELVALLVTGENAEDYVYISMGGNHLRDHVAIYRRAGLRNLYAFDLDRDVVDRQLFNRPFEGVVCETHPSGELPSRLDKIMQRFDAEHAIIWLDYTRPKRLEQLREVQAIAEKLQIGDIVKVTMNADFRGLENYESQLTPEEKELPQGRRNAALLRRMLGTYLPRSISEVDYKEMVGALANCIRRACIRGVEGHPDDRRPRPVLLTKYHDTTDMLTVTVMMTDSNGLPECPKGWVYAPDSWEEIEMIMAPDLSARERLALDQLMHRSPREVQEELGFVLDEAAVKAYSRYHRFYPSFQAVID